MRAFLVDTGVLIDFLRGREPARALLSSLAEESSLSCSAITVAEIYAGMREHERGKTEGLIDGLEVLDVTAEVAKKAGAYKRGLKSHSLELADCLIAATAFVSGSVLVTGNRRHYPMADVETLTP